MILSEGDMTPDKQDDGRMEPVVWTVWRARENPVRTGIVVFFIVAFLAFAFWYFGLLLSVVAVVALAVTLHSYFLPIDYRMDAEGITVKKRIFNYTYPWAQFRRWFRTTGGVVVSPFSRRTFLDNFRGVHILLPTDPTPVIAYFERRFAERHEG